MKVSYRLDLDFAILSSVAIDFLNSQNGKFVFYGTLRYLIFYVYVADAVVGPERGLIWSVPDSQLSATDYRDSNAFYHYTNCRLGSERGAGAWWTPLSRPPKPDCL